MVKNVGLYLVALWNQWKVLLTGGTAMALVTIWALSTNKGLPYNLGWLIVGLTFIAASFRAWKVEHEKAKSAETALQRKHPADEAHFNEVRDSLTNFDEPEKRFLRTVLHNGEVSEVSVRTEIDRRAIEKGVGCLFIKERFGERPGGQRIYQINETHKEALRDLLYPSADLSGQV